jgi:hypothetical protein
MKGFLHRGQGHETNIKFKAKEQTNQARVVTTNTVSESLAKIRPANELAITGTGK